MPLISVEHSHNSSEIHDLATEISSAADHDVPALLLRIQRSLDRFPSGSNQLSDCKLQLWSYNLPEIIPSCLKQDFSRHPLGWEASASLAAILVHISIGFEPANLQQFNAVFLTKAADSLLSVACAIYMKYAKTSGVLEDVKQKLLTHFKSILESVTFLITSHTSLILHVMQSPWLLQLLMAEDGRIATVVMTMIQSANRILGGMLGEINEEVFVQLLDEIVYKLSTSANENVASTSTRTLLLFSDTYPETVQMLCSRYRGLRVLLGKWSRSSMGRDVRRLQLLLESGSVKKAENTKLHRSASLIQALWRSHKTRKTLKWANSAIATFQHTYRICKADRDNARHAHQEAAELRHMLLLSRRRLVRHLREKRLASIKLLPAADVYRFLENERSNAAVKVQSVWRGHKVRRSLAKKRTNVRRHRSAVKIQQAVRRWLKSVRARQVEPPVWQRPPGLTDERRVDIQAEITEWKDRHGVKASSRDQQVALHGRVQEMLRHDANKCRNRRKQEQHIAAVIGQLELDSTLLIESPKLTSVNQSDAALYTSHAAPIAAAARRNHSNELRLLRQPWWRKLGDEYQDERETEAEMGWRIL